MNPRSATLVIMRTPKCPHHPHQRKALLLLLSLSDRHFERPLVASRVCRTHLAARRARAQISSGSSHCSLSASNLICVSSRNENEIIVVPWLTRPIVCTFLASLKLNNAHKRFFFHLSLFLKKKLLLLCFIVFTFQFYIYAYWIWKDILLYFSLPVATFLPFTWRETMIFLIFFLLMLLKLQSHFKCPTFQNWGHCIKKQCSKCSASAFFF